MTAVEPDLTSPPTRLNNRLLPGVVLFLLVWQMLFPAKVWMVLLVSLGGAWLGSYLWARSLRKNLTLQREMRFGWAQVGDHLEERFTVRNQGILPAMWVEVRDLSSLPGRSANRICRPAGEETVRWVTERVCEKRGVYTLGPTRLIFGDPLGLYTVSLDFPQQAGIMVMPPTVPLPEVEIAPGGRAEEGRRLRRDVMEVTVSAAGVRDYQPGDALKNIHWPTSARKNQLFVRQFESAPSSDWWIFLDVNERAQAGEGFVSTEEHSVILAASLMDLGMRHGKAVGLVASGDSLVWLPPQGTAAQRLQFLRALTTIRSGQTPLAQLLTHTLPRFSRRTSVILITPDVSGEWLDSLLMVTARGGIPTVMLFDPRSFGGIGDPAPLNSELERFGMQTYILDSQVLDLPEARPGQRGQWKWKTLGTGRAIAIQKPIDIDWKELPG